MAQEQLRWTPTELLPEGYEKEQEYDPWVEIFAARQNHLTLEAPVVGIEKHTVAGEEVPCLVVMFDHIKGLIPLSESELDSEAKMRRFVGLPVQAKIIGIQKDDDLVLLSRKAAREQSFARTWPQIEVGKVYPATVQIAYQHRIILDLTGVTGILERAEAGWGYIDDMRDEFVLGQPLEVRVIEKIENDGGHKIVRVSMKDPDKCPWPGVTKRYQPGNLYAGRVTGAKEWGVFVNLEPGVDVLCKQPKFDFARIKKGDRVAIRITRFNPEQQRVYGTIQRKLNVR